jgi:hypothetical protein
MLASLAFLYYVKNCVAASGVPLYASLLPGTAGSECICRVRCSALCNQSILGPRTGISGPGHMLNDLAIWKVGNRPVLMQCGSLGVRHAGIRYLLKSLPVDFLPGEVCMPTLSGMCMKWTRRDCRPFCCCKEYPDNYSATVRTLEKLKYTHRRRLSKAYTVCTSRQESQLSASLFPKPIIPGI